ncbi:FAD-dependent oxidoreductase [Aspergillus chevalieri]|uniref:FAD dependent oxidoreductase domain-containing protein n=1 Tax=Aspergillus chevalieri TaxID=182096 RepID=A0A7R7VSP6_ASPCH|nr:uncharacterized protein ACHE_51214A [Aspergillus chevalieri]BCR90016.1 hypothetical protein ACHE_51214A [Aspergillus chevalieri]
MPPNETIVVIGAGVIGLTTALTLQTHLSPSQSILLIARDFPSTTSINYASPWAGAHYRPIPGTTPQALRESSQARRTYAAFKRLVTQEPAAGIEEVEGVEYLENPPEEYLEKRGVEDAYSSYLDGFCQLRSGGDGEDGLPEGVKWGVRYKTFVVNSPVYCAHLLRRFVLNGGRTMTYDLADTNEAFYVGENVKTVVSCSGMGFNDPKSFIIKGQTCLVRNPCAITLTRQNSDGTWSFCIPRPLYGGTIIGGTKEPNNWDPNPSPQTRAKILSNAAKWFPFTAQSQGKFDVIRDIVGRRPAREGGMRIEIERIADGKTVVHAYGAGGRGFELSVGVAEDVVDLMFENGILRTKGLL